MPQLRRLALITALAVTTTATSAAALSKVEFKVLGVSDEVARQLEDAMKAASLSQKALDDESTDALSIYGAARADYRQMIAALYAKGYYGPVVSITADGQEVADFSPFNLPSDIDRIDIQVTPGPKFTFGVASVAPRAPNAEAGSPPVEGFAPGEPAESGLIGSAVNAAVGEWRDNGNPKVAVASENVIARHRDAQLDVDVRLNPGPRLRFGTVEVVGESDVKRKRIKEMLGLPTGKWVTPTQANRAVDRLRRAGAFQTVVLQEADQPNADGTLDYTVTVVDELPRRFGFSAEYSTTEGGVVSGYWMHRNLFGGAEQLRIDAEASGIGGDLGGYGTDYGGEDYSSSFRLTRPAAWGPDNAAFLFGTAEHEDEPEYLEDKATLGIGLNRWFNSKLEGETAIGLRYSYAEDAFGEREFNHVYLPSKLEWDGRGDAADPKNGLYFGGYATPLIGYLGSENLAQLKLDSRAYISFGGDRVTLAGRAVIGGDLGARTENTPPDYLFFSGGGDTVRGQRYQSLGASELNGDVIGGRSFFGAQAEIRGRVTDTIGVVAFYDYGAIGDQAWVGLGYDDHSGVGLGLRYNTAIGPIRVDVATPYQGAVKEFSRAELYIGVGQAF